jgi:hypothetical protein
MIPAEKSFCNWAAILNPVVLTGENVTVLYRWILVVYGEGE